MTPFIVEIEHGLDPGPGDCIRTALACLLDMPPDRIPHFAETSDIFADQWKAMVRWLAERGLYAFSFWIKAASLSEAVAEISPTDPAQHYMVICLDKDVGHCVICQHGRISHDPAKVITPPGELLPFHDGRFLEYFSGACPWRQRA